MSRARLPISAARAVRCLTVLWLALVLAPVPAMSQSTLYTVTGVEADVKAESAAKAKVEAINEAQLKAFRELARRLAGDKGEARAAGLGRADVSRMMRSLSIESERTGPGRYIAKLTFRFFPDKVRQQFAKFGIAIADEQAPLTIVLPVWRTTEGDVLWQDNPWRDAWTGLRAENAIVPLIIPIGDLADSQTITPAEAMAGDQLKLDALRIRYKADDIVVAVAAPQSATTVRAVVNGDTPVGRTQFDKTFDGGDGGIAAAAADAASRFHSILTEKWQEEHQPRPVQSLQLASQSVSIAVPFNSLAEWNALRGRLGTVPGVAAVDVTTVSAGGAIVKLAYNGSFEALQNSLGASGMPLTLVGGTWVLQVY